MVDKYPKIDSIFKRDQKGKMLWGQFSTPEIEYLRDCEWVWTEKVDGTNIRLTHSWDGMTDLSVLPYMHVGGRTDNAQIPVYLYDKCMDILKNSPFSEVFPREVFTDVPITLYGEGYGAKIQKGGGNYKSDGVDFVIFDVKVGDTWLKRPDVEDVGKKLGIDVVPVVGIAPLNFAITIVRDNLLNSHWPGVIPEGLVGTTQIPLFDRRGRRIMTKIKGRDFG